jgi:hypothetical protein
MDELSRHTSVISKLMDTKLKTSITIDLYKNGYVSFQIADLGSEDLVGTDLHALLGAIELTKAALLTEGMHSMAELQKVIQERADEEIQRRASKGPVGPSSPEQTEGTQSTD